MRELIDQESDLSGAIFEGGLSREDLDSLVEGFPDKKAKELREKLESHIGKPASHQPPEDSGAITRSLHGRRRRNNGSSNTTKAMSSVPMEGQLS